MSNRDRTRGEYPRPLGFSSHHTESDTERSPETRPHQPVITSSYSQIARRALPSHGAHASIPTPEKQLLPQRMGKSTLRTKSNRPGPGETSSQDQLPGLFQRRRLDHGYILHMDHPNTRDVLRKFMAEREWGQFHSAENLAKSIAIEAAELLECFQWTAEPDIDSLRLELADVLTYSYLLADQLEEVPEELILEKLAITEEKYPVSIAKGRSDKYDKLSH